MTRRRGSTRLSLAGRLGRAVRLLVGIVLLLAVVYLAIALFIDRVWAGPVVLAVIVLLVVVPLVGRWRRWRRRQSIGHLLRSTPTDFEETVARLLSGAGFRKVRRTGGSGDLTVDVIAHDRAGRFVVVQCKRYLPGRLVGSSEMQTFIGMMTVQHHASYGIYATTSGYTRPAQVLARQHGITLIDGQALADLLAGGRSVQLMRR